MDSSLKQRLVGAAVLVALAVIFLPMLVGGPEPQTDAVSVPIDIPTPPERAFETRELPLTAPLAGAASSVPPTDDPNRIVTVEAQSTAPVDVMPENAVEPAPLAAATQAATAADAAKPPASVPAATPTPTAPSVPTPAAASTPPAATPAVTPGGRYVVNLGSYGTASNAQALITALKGAGLPAYSESIALDGKPGQRVRLGPYAQRGEAEAARLAVGKLRADLTASVVALDDAASAQAPMAVRTPVASGFAVQLGALANEVDANALRARAKNAGFTAFVERAATENGVLWRVRVGPELQRTNAEKLKAAVAAKLGIDGVIVSHP